MCKRSEWILAGALGGLGMGALAGPLGAAALVVDDARRLPSADGSRAAVHVAGSLTVAVDPNLDRHPISRLIYGVNFGSDAQDARLHWPVRRWGGNSATRYNWETNTRNSAADWFYFNYQGGPDNGNHTADQFLDTTRANGSQPLLTVPLIGWKPKDGVRRWGFSVAKYGPQQNTECTVTGFPDWCNHDAGNGLHTNGSPITGNDPHDTSAEIGPDYASGWMAHIMGRLGSAANGGLQLYALDNEPSLWNSTHRDVHPAAPTYDELWQRTQDYAAAMKAQDPGAQILGVVAWGWCAYFYSAADGNGCGLGSQTDRLAHGDLEFIDWFLKQAADYQTAHGVRLVDYLDLHYYPQNNGVSLSTDESAAVAATRLRSLKSLYDPAYVDESWIGQTVKLIPRMKAWVAARLPGTKLALTEYNWGDGTTSSALAQAEALSIFGREGLDLATRWVAPPENSLLEDAFSLYLNYDGAGTAVAGDSVRATSSNVDQLGAYAVRGAGDRLFLLLFNKDTTDHSTTVNVAGAVATPATLYRFDATHRLAAAGSVAPSAGALVFDLPPRSATLAIVDGPPQPATSFYTLTPCRVADTRNASGAYGAPPLAANAARSFLIWGQCGVPSGATAITANLTVVSPQTGGDLRAYPGGTSAPLASAINFAAGQTRANNGVLPLGSDGSLAILHDGIGQVNLVIDVNGYFQ